MIFAINSTKKETIKIHAPKKKYNKSSIVFDPTIERARRLTLNQKTEQNAN